MAKPYSQELIEKVKTLFMNGYVQFDIARELNLTRHQVKRIVRKSLTKEQIKDTVKKRQETKNSYYLNKKFGRLFVKACVYKNNATYFECLCDCGNTAVKPKGDIANGNTKSCGCLAADRVIAFEDISGKYWTRLQKAAIERNIAFDLDIEDAWNIFIRQNKQCALTGVPLQFVKDYSKYKNQTASLDRIDNSGPYSKENVQWVHKRANNFRGGLSLDQIYSLSKKIYDNHRTNELNTALNKWDFKYLSLAEFIASWSKDKTTKVGAVIFDDNFRVVSLGYNGFPQKIEDKDEWLSNRDTKLKIIIHAEMNALLFSQRNLTGCSIATWPMMPCSNCASAIIQAGIKRVISLENDIARWQESFAISKTMFQEKKVELKLYKNTISDSWLE